MTAALKINGTKFDSFERGAVALTMESPFNNFEVSYLADGKDQSVRSIFPGDEMQFALDGEVIDEGYVDATSDDDDPDSGVTLSAQGRSRTADLVDCSAIERPFTWKDTTIDRIALDLCRPFGIDVHVIGSAGLKLEQFAVIRGESVFDALARAVYRRGKLLYCAAGDLVIGSVGSTRTKTVLVRGQEPLVRSARGDSWLDRYSNYVFSAQAPGKDDRWGKDAAQLRWEVEDTGISRYRPILVPTEAHHPKDLETRARVECNQRAGRGERIQATVLGWQTAEGHAWRPNTIVRFRNPVLGVDADLLVVSAVFQFGAEAPPETVLSLCRPEAFTLDPYPPTTRGQPWR